jgi:antitoxin ParD1/3/4
MNVNLTPRLESYVQQKVAEGGYESTDEVIREAVRLLEERDKIRAAKIRDLRAAIQEGLDSGDPVPWDPEEGKRRGRELLAASQKVEQVV